MPLLCRNIGILKNKNMLKIIFNNFIILISLHKIILHYD